MIRSYGTDRAHLLPHIPGGLSGECFFGFPVMSTPEGPFSFDGVLVSKEKGIVILDSKNGADLADRQDLLYNRMESKLRVHGDLLEKRRLLVPISVITVTDGEVRGEEGYPVASRETLTQTLLSLPDWEGASEELYERTLSAIESVRTIRKPSHKRDCLREDSRGAKLKRLEEETAVLDSKQAKLAIESVDGIERIRGLAGSGKSIVLALKAAYLHIRHPEWRIAVVFYTRSLKEYYERLINRICIECGTEPDWDMVRVVNAWGAPGSEERDGIYYEFCRATGQEFHDFRSASRRAGMKKYAFDWACSTAMEKAEAIPALYDAILVDEAQDLPASFLRMCHRILREPKRLAYAYDEFQSLSGTCALPEPEDIFGEAPARDLLLPSCYRSPRPVLVTAHALGLGVYRKGGMVSRPDPELWPEIGYEVTERQPGGRMVLERTPATSPAFLEAHSPIDDLVVVKAFASEEEQNRWLVGEIVRNIREDELRPEDILVVHPDFSGTEYLRELRSLLVDRGIPCHIVGVDTEEDEFSARTPSVALSSVFRAKGNEAGMVYVVCAHTCVQAAGRNRLFAAITRSRAWVRIVGYGPEMDELVREYGKLKENGFRLKVKY